MDMAVLREYLISKGVPAEHLDEVSEPPVLRDIGEALTLSLINDDALGEAVVALLVEVETLKQRVAVLEGGGA